MTTPMTTPTPHVSKFALRAFSGKPTRYFRVEAAAIHDSAPVAEPSDVIFVVDRSGSMYGDMDPMKAMLEKFMAVSEWKNPRLRFSLITYSSKGDVRVEFRHVTAEAAMAPGSAELRAVRAIRATAMTCISQGLIEAEKLIDDTRVTAIALHTDGWANDLSPVQEARDIDAALKLIQRHPRAFVNAVAYRDYVDYNLLSRIAGACSGRCIQARTIAQVHEALTDTTRLVANTMAPAVEAAKGDADYVLFVSRAAGKILGSPDSLTVRGLAPTDDKTVYRLHELAEGDYAALAVPVNGDGADPEPVLAYARAMVSAGNLVAAKQALVATRNAALISDHARAMVASDVAAFAAATETAVMQRAAYTPMSDYGLPASGPSVSAVCAVIDRHARHLEVNLPALTAGYKRRGLRRINGTRDAAGVFTPAPYDCKPRASADGYVSVGACELNNNTATINLRVDRDADLVDTAAATVIPEVAGIKLALRTFNNYTLVGDGELNVRELTLRTGDKSVFRAFKELGAVSGDYAPNAPFTVRLEGCPLVDYETMFTAPRPEDFRRLAELKTASKLLGDLFKGESITYTAEQVAELGKYNLSAKLNFSAPTVNEEADEDAAIAAGRIDTRLSYQIDFGSPQLTSVTKLRSANEALDRRFVATVAGKAEPKAKCTMIPGNATAWSVKKLSARTQLDYADGLAYPLLAGFLGVEPTDSIAALFASVGEDYGTYRATLAAADKDAAVAATVRVAAAFDRAIEDIYAGLRPLAFYVGATGMLPEGVSGKSLTADEVSAQYPDAKLSKGEKDDGTFFLLDNGTLLTVYVKAVRFTPSPVVAAAA